MDALGWFLAIVIFCALLSPNDVGEWVGKVIKAARKEME